MLNFAFYHLMYYHDKLSYRDENIMIVNTVVKSLSHTTTEEGSHLVVTLQNALLPNVIFSSIQLISLPTLHAEDNYMYLGRSNYNFSEKCLLNFHSIDIIQVCMICLYHSSLLLH